RAGRGRAGARRRLWHGRLDLGAGGARGRARRGGGLRLLGVDARARPAQGPGHPVRPGQCARPPLPRRCLRRRHRRLRRAQLLRPAPGPGRDGARGAPGRARRRARDHQPPAAAAVVVPSGVVRPPGAHARARHRAGRRLQLPAQLGAPLPRSRGACGYARIRGPREDPLGVDRGRNHRHPRRGAPVVATAPTVDAVVRAAGPHVAALMGRIEERLAAVIAGHGELLAAHAGSTIAAGGKRLRPLLVLVAAGPDATGDGIVRAAVAVELVHSATLVHDDVLDAAALRRGRPTVVASAGRDIATATGDLLFSRAFAELADNGRVDEIQVLSDAGSALAAGELLQRADAWDGSVPVQRYLERCELKTARLFEAACMLGALEGADADG